MINKNDTIGIIALAGACEKEKIEQAVINIENLYNFRANSRSPSFVALAIKN